MKPFITLIFILFLISSCGNDKNNLIGQWNMKHLDFDPDNSRLLKMGINTYNRISFDHLATHHSFILAKDNFFIYSFGGSNNISVCIGNWEYLDSDSLLTLNIVNSAIFGSLKMKIKSLNNKNLIFTLDMLGKGEIMKGAPGIFQFACYKAEKDICDSEYNFASLKMNKWRIPSKHKEEKEQIKGRIEEGMDFAITFFKYYKSKNKTVTTNILKPLPYVFASNGIGFEKNTDWENLFFDEEDANISYEIIQNAFIQSQKKIPDEVQENPITLNLYILENIKQKINE
jgi:hypothetical protein